MEMEILTPTNSYVYKVNKIGLPHLLIEEHNVNLRGKHALICGAQSWQPIEIDADECVCDAISEASPCSISYYSNGGKILLDTVYVSVDNNQLFYKNAIIDIIA